MKKKYITYEEYLKRYDKKNRTLIYVDEDKLSRQNAHKIIHSTDRETMDKNSDAQDSADISKKMIENNSADETESNEPSISTAKNAETENRRIEYYGESSKTHKKSSNSFNKDERLDTNAVQKNGRNGGIGLFGMSVLMISFVVAVLSANLLAKGLSYGHFFGTTRRVSLSENNYYAIQTGAYTSKDDAYEKAVETRRKGGAGYVFREGGLYRVIANIYQSEQDAQIVVDGMAQQSESANIYILKIPPITADFNASQESINIIENAFEFLYGATERLDNFAVALDKGDSGASSTRLEILKLKSEAENELQEIEKIMDSVSDLRLIRIKAELTVLINSLSDLNGESLSDADFSAEIRYAYCGALFGYRSLLAEIL